MRPHLHLVTMIALGGTVVCLAQTQAAAPRSDGQRRPNVLFLAIDDLNDWTGSLKGHPQTQTPHLDRLADRGVLFSRAYCSAPACNPSRASLLCGIRPSTSGVYINPQPWRGALPDAVTLPQHFMAAGYHVVGGGKIFHGPYKDPASWHEYFGRPHDPAPAKLPANGIKTDRHFDWGPLDVPDEAMGDTQVTQWAIDYLRKKHDRPFFLAVGLYRPHLPWFVPRPWFDQHPLAKIELPLVREDDLDDLPPAGLLMAKPDGDHRKVLATDNWSRGVQAYLASISFTDACVGRLMQALEETGQADNTIIVMWSDHGWHLGEKQHWRKFTLWEEATRVPMTMVVPGLTPRGQTCDRTVSLLDIYPTLVDLCSLPGRSELEGKSLTPLLRDPAAEWARPVVTTHGRWNHAVRSERWRYIRYKDKGEELYDHDKDPNEWTNLADRSEFKEVKRGLAVWFPKVNAPNAQLDEKRRLADKARKEKQEATK